MDTAIYQRCGRLVNILGYVNSNIFRSGAPPPGGEFASVTEQGSPDSNILYQDIAVPPNSDVSCSVIVYLVNYNEGGESSNYVIGDGLTLNTVNQQMRVDLMDPDADPFDTGAGVLENLFQTLPGDPNNIGYTTLNFDLSPYAGQTVRFRAAVVVTQAPLIGSIDELSCPSIVTHNIPTLSEWGMTRLRRDWDWLECGLFFAGKRQRTFKYI